ncbi:hypothetical protein E8E12_007421 [Didymella heteroderae]|uniref:SMP-30/Gluconolactonase/LRE-like region domain-containing protein n=1 Tax=Didymella heteroderae TaxID=1769908 RepID=A0A9P5BYX6_9PLEO|nr:hypothetical protein E8E12_007421 [Didymella heteroderae]
MWFQRTLATLALFCVTFSEPVPNDYRSHPQFGLPLATHTVAQLSSVPTWLENIAVRNNGDLLVTQFAPAPVLHTVRSPSLPNATLENIYEFKTITNILGIAETRPDTFVVVGGNATANATGYVGTFSAWEVNFSKDTVMAHKIVDIPEAMFLNGAVVLPDAASIVLIADSQLGLLFRLDTRRRTYEVIADRPEFKPHPERFNKTVGFGINGVKIRDRFLYFSNTNLVNIYRVPITEDGYLAKDGKAPVELYADLNAVTTFIDDFEIGSGGTVWVVTNDDNTLIAVTPRSRIVEVVAGAKDQLTLAGGTGAAFGRTKKDRHVLYVSTAGGLDAPVNGTLVEPGKVVGLDTQKW